MSQIQYKVITDEKNAKKYWQLFSPHQTQDDEWDFRYTWTKYLELPYHFIVGFDGVTPIGVLPLQLNTLKGLGPRLLNMDQPYLEFFGGVDSDNNDLFLLPGYEKYAPEFFEQIDKPAVLTSLKNQITVNGVQAEFYLDKFSVDLRGITDFDSYIDLHLSGKTRRSVKHELRRSKMEGYTVEIQTGTKEDLPLLFKLSQDRFGERSSFHREDRRKVFYDFFDVFNVDIFKVIVNDEIKAVVYGIIYNETYTGMNLGYDYSIPSFGKYLLTASVARAVELGCTLYDAGQGDNGYKGRLHITQTPQYKLSLNLHKNS